MMFTTRFNDANEFIDELRAHPPNIMKIVRVTSSYQQSQTLPLQNVSVISTYLRSKSGALVERVMLDCYIGQRYSHHDDDVSKRVLKKAQATADKITAAAIALKLEVRAGIYE